MSLEPYLGFGKALAIVAAAIGLFTVGHHYGAQGERLKAADLARKQLEATQLSERALREQVDTITAAREKEKQDAQQLIEDYRARVRAGTVRLSIPAKCPAIGSPAVGDTPARAELVPAVADDLISLAADGDAAVRDLNECIAKYDAVRGQRGQFPPTN